MFFYNAFKLLSCVADISEKSTRSERYFPLPPLPPPAHPLPTCPYFLLSPGSLVHYRLFDLSERKRNAGYSGHWTVQSCFDFSDNADLVCFPDVKKSKDNTLINHVQSHAWHCILSPLRLFIASSAHFCTVLDRLDQSIVPRKFFSSSGMARGWYLSLKQPTGSNLRSRIQDIPISKILL